MSDAVEPTRNLLNTSGRTPSPADDGKVADDVEIFEELVRGQAFRLERITSTGQCTPPGEWLEQPEGEWVALLSGAAGLRFENEQAVRELQSGDYVLIPAGRRHRVEWTAADRETVWLALHFEP